MSDYGEIRRGPTDPGSQRRIEQRLALIASLDSSNPATDEEVARLQEEIDVLQIPRGRLMSGRLAWSAITCYYVTDDDGFERMQPLMPYDNTNPIHRLAKEEGMVWPEVNRDSMT